ncbi:MAG: spermidine/putrescine ABC transporter substrate-binding protein [Alphaproteobacteria bacterium]|nr:spermidine/putrescine ABC transporter substrate-binding protein [Alphaproteobacteria bacterium]MCB9699466.1 spermidine/putrescine ABC transporter substrate-binding protein [Alphaproteobacteria bacterium]
MDRKNADAMFEDFLAGRLDRRSFVTRLLALGASATTTAALLEACSGGTTETPKPADGGGGDGDEHAKAKGKGKHKADGDGENVLPETKELSIYNWSDYIAEDVVPEFEKETGIKVTYNTYESNEEMMAKLQVGAGGYDLVVPTGYIVTVLAAQDLLFPLRKKKLTNWANLHPMFLNPSFDPDNKYSVPWLWGTTGIAYRADKVKAPPDSWAVFHDTQYKNKMTQMDDQRDVIGSWLKFRGKSLNSTDKAELDQAKADALQSKALLKAYVSAPVKGQLVSGDVWIAQLWNGDTMQAKAENEQIAYALPKEGAGLWTDSLVIPKSAPNIRNALAFMDFCMRPEIATKIADFTGYGSPNAKATPETPIAYPTDEEMKRLEIQKDLGEALQIWDQIWTEIKAG